jgi:short-subunit dehydrogenase
MELRAAHVLITGASRGIGAAMAERFADAGANVSLAARSEGPLRELAERLGGEAHVADLAATDDRRGLIARVEAAGGPLDVLVNNAGVDLTGAFDKLSADELENVFLLNAVAPAELARQVIPGMVARGQGHIVNVSSLAGVAVLPGMAAYSATKAALTHLTAGLRADLRGLPIGTTVVEAGLIKPTEMAESVLSYGPTRAAFARLYRIGMLRDSDRDDVAAAVVAAVAAGKRHVRLPKRARLTPMLAESARRTVELLLTGVRPRE